MKKLLSLILALVLVFSLTACSSGTTDESVADSTSVSESISEEPAQSESVTEGASESESTSTDSAAVVTDYTFEAPEGFTENEENPGMLYAPNYPTDASNIYVLESEPDAYFDQYTAEILDSGLDASLTEQLGEDIDVTIDEFKYFTINDLPAYRLVMHYTFSGVDLTQLQIGVNASKNYTFTYTQSGDTNWMDAFRASADTISFVVE